MNGAPRTRLVLVGASNLTLYLPTVLAHARAAFGGPLEVLTANGLGRSYGASSNVLGRELSGITTSGLWDALERAAARERLPTAALVTDIGNDLVYGREPAEIAGWVEQVLERLAAHDARVALTQLPLAAIEALGPRRFALARALYFPSHRIDLDTVRGRARELSSRVEALARARGIAPVAQPAAWFGLDPIHVRPRRRAEAWRTILAGWPAPEGARAAGLGWREALAVRRARAHGRRVFGRPARAADVRSRDGGALVSY